MEIDGTGKLRGPDHLEAQAQAVKSRPARFGVWTGNTWFFESADPGRKNAQQLELSIGKQDVFSSRLFS